jgi:hypothetical protein
LLNKFPSIFVFVITYHAARQMIEIPVIFFHMSCTTASWQHCRKAKEGDSQVGNECLRQDKSLKDLPRTP